MNPFLRVHTVTRLSVVATLALAVGCSKTSSNDVNVANTVTQDLTTDPNGFVTVVTFDRAAGFLGAGVFESDGGQTPLAVDVTGATAAVTWDERVTPNDRVRVVGVEGILESWRRVVASDARRPTVTIDSATQDTSDNLLGGDTIVLSFANGPRMIEEVVENADNWALSVASVPLDLSGSTFDFDVPTQVLTITLGARANLHATFRLTPSSLSAVNGQTLNNAGINGNATGDTTAPSLVGGSPVTQNLDALASGDVFGRVIELQFDEPISPVFGITPSNFTAIEHPGSQGATLVTAAQIDAVDHSLVRVTFSQPIVPGLDSVRVSQLRDAHGNLFPTQTFNPVPSAAVANGYESVEGLTRAGQENDQIVVLFDQALDPDTAANANLWTLTMGAPFGVIDLATQTLSYDMLSRQLTIDLDFDFPNGTTVDLACLGAVDIDGDAFALAAPQVVAAGDSIAPVVTNGGIIQRRDLDPSGLTVDVRFSEAVDPVAGAIANNFTFAPAVIVNSATPLGDGTLVRLSLATVAVPGDHSLTVGAAVGDPAGNTPGAAQGPSPVATTDQVAPAIQFVAASAVEGANNDVINVLFNDWMVPAEVESVLAWTVESPVGTPLDVTTSSVVYSEGSQLATLTLAGAAIQLGQSLSVSFQNARDLGGNAIGNAASLALVRGEMRRPNIDTVWRADAPSENLVIVRFDEAIADADDLFHATNNVGGVKYTVYTSTAVLRGAPNAATIIDDGLGVILDFPFTVDLTDTLDIIGLTDLAGNVLFPSLNRIIEAEDTSVPSHGAAPVMTAISGERNDTIVVTFSVPMAAWHLLDPAQYTLQANGGGAVIDLVGSTFAYDGNTTLTITLSGAAAASLQSGTTYDLVLEVDPMDPLRTRQGVALTVPDTTLGTVVIGDTVNGPTQGATSAALDSSDPNSLYIVFDEAVAEAAAETAAAYDYDGGNIALAAMLVSPRVVLVTFGVAVAAGNVVEVSTAAAVDLAGNPAAATLSLTVVDDQTAPVLTQVIGEVIPTAGTDRIRVRFNEMVELASALDVANYSITDSRGNVGVQAATFDSTLIEVTLYTIDLLDGGAITVSVTGVSDVAGNTPPAALVLGGAVSGDSAAPAIGGAFVNLGFDNTGRTIEVEFSETVLTGFADVAGNWSTTGGATVTAATRVAGDHVRLTLSQALVGAEAIELLPGLTDRAGNSTLATLSVTPIQ